MDAKSGVTKACFYEPAMNRTYADMAAHYGTAVVPARPYKPRDKAKVEVAVQIAERWIVVSQTRRRHVVSQTRRRHDAPAQSEVLLVGGIERRNPRPPRPAERPRHPASRASRRDLFDQVARSALRPLPAEPYVFCECKQCTVGLDYHVEVDKHYYSAPHRLLREKVWVRLTASRRRRAFRATRTVEIFHHGNRIAAHARTSANRQHTTIADHMPAR
jgi:transposase